MPADDFVVLTDIDYVTYAFNPRYIVAVVLTENGDRTGFRPYVSVLFHDGTCVENLAIPTVEHGDYHTARESIDKFFNTLGMRSP